MTRFNTGQGRRPSPDLGNNIMKNRIPVTFVLAAIASSGAAFPCTNVFTTADNTRLAASNLDCNNYFPRVWFVPPAESEFGRFCFGTDKNERFDEPITFNFHQGLKQGRHGYLLRDLAPVRPYVSEVYENFSSRSSK